MYSKKQPATIVACCLCLFILSSCIGPFTLQDIAHQKLKFGDSSQSFVIRNNQILVPAKINGEDDTLFFDTGLMSTVVKFSDSANANGKIFTRKSTTPFGQATYRYNKYITDIHNTIWNFDNYLGVELFVDLPQCTTYPLKLIGFNAITSNHNAPYFFLNFEQKELSFKSFTNGVLPQYKEVKSSFTKKGLFIYLNVNDTTMPFLFDTGYGTTLIINNKPKNRDSDIVGEYIGTIYASPLKLVSSDNIFYDNISVLLDSAKTLEHTGIAVFLSQSKNNIAGLQFLEHFNWIIDNLHKKVWVRPIKEGKSIIQVADNDYLFSEINDKLVIVAKKKEEKLKLPLFRQIVKVNDECVTEDNICYYIKYLNSPENLSTSELTFKK